MSDAQHQAVIEAANHFNQAGRTLMSLNDTFHPETLILSMARMAGSLMYRSFDFDSSIAPGTAVLSENANSDGPRLMNVMFAALQQLGHTIGQDALKGPAMSADCSQLGFEASHAQLAPSFLAYCRTVSLPFHDAALGGAIATAITIHDCREVVPVDSAASLAVYGFVEGTKTAPFPVPDDNRPGDQSAKARPKKPWYKLW